jgi:hypothetical protein
MLPAKAITKQAEPGFHSELAIVSCPPQFRDDTAIGRLQVIYLHGTSINLCSRRKSKLLMRWIFPHRCVRDWANDEMNII